MRIRARGVRWPAHRAVSGRFVFFRVIVVPTGPLREGLFYARSETASSGGSVAFDAVTR